MTAVLYSADEVADMLGLHVRTVRNYVRDGRLPAVKIGKQYRIAPADVDRLTGGRAPDRPAKGIRSAAKVEVTVVAQLDVVDTEAMARLSALVTGAVSNRRGDSVPLRVETVHDPLRETAKVIAIGDTEDTAALLTLIGTFAQARQ